MDPFKILSLEQNVYKWVSVCVYFWIYCYIIVTIPISIGISKELEHSNQNPYDLGKKAFIVRMFFRLIYCGYGYKCLFHFSVASVFITAFFISWIKTFNIPPVCAHLADYFTESVCGYSFCIYRWADWTRQSLNSILSLKFHGSMKFETKTSAFLMIWDEVALKYFFWS